MEINDAKAKKMFKQSKDARAMLERCGFNDVGTGGGFSAWVKYFPNCEVIIHADNCSMLEPPVVDTMGITICVGSDDDFVWTGEAWRYEDLAPALVEAVCVAMDQGETA